jgi:hypothetical protein
MGESTRPAVAAQCDCPDCRHYRLWRAEGTDEWQPDANGWNPRSAAVEPYAAVDVDAIVDPPTTMASSLG